MPEEKLCCPICRTEEVEETSTGNNGVLMVAEEIETAMECYDPDIKMYTCKNQHTFYIHFDIEE